MSGCGPCQFAQRAKSYPCVLSLLLRKGLPGVGVAHVPEARGRKMYESIKGEKYVCRYSRIANSRSEALAVHDARATLVVLILRDPHLLERAQRRQDGPANPDGVLPLRRCHNLHLHGGRRQRGDLLVQPLVDAREHGGAAGEDRVRVEVPADVDVALLDRVVRELVDAHGLL